MEPNCNPVWVVVGAGTGGTSATLGRFIRYYGRDTQLCVVDPDQSVFFDFYRTGKTPTSPTMGARIEGIGRPVVEPSFIPQIIDAMIQVPDRWSIAGMLFLEQWLGRRVGPSTGTNLIGAFELIQQMNERRETGSVVTLICDSGERYGHSFFDSEWRLAHGLDSTTELALLQQMAQSGIGNTGCAFHRRGQAIMS